MVTRYPHTAILKLQRGGGMVDGEWSDGEEFDVELAGRLEVASGKRVVKNTAGNEITITYEFFCKKFEYEGKPLSLTVMGIEKPVVDIEQWQTHYTITL